MRLKSFLVVSFQPCSARASIGDFDGAKLTTNKSTIHSWKKVSVKKYKYIGSRQLLNTEANNIMNRQFFLSQSQATERSSMTHKELQNK
jgi:hypothetical protein